ncbi:fatty acyl-AMP ligase [Microbacterium ureisolvens]|uniref:Fatty acyl-AMP ligase n=1 Tax=Microbacterium ureisolvens TaxID=2781186 RepID=A0ABS7I2I6_9MICO|nr:fatty acyl-AMP ligase [Microbacterium ureisolvens]MBW9110955.1 fatty acyl-AMP ligase [Microbacterium ureisolvens]
MTDSEVHVPGAEVPTREGGAPERGSEFVRRLRLTAATAEGRGIRFYRSPTDFSEATYAELDADARARAVELAGAGLVPGDVAILAFEPGLPFVRALLACLYAGVAAAPVPITAMRNADAVRQRLFAILQDAGAKAVLTETGALDGLGLAGETSIADAVVIPVDGPASGSADEWRMPDIDESALAILQYTSGSTGLPKGVMVSHGNLYANQQAIGGIVGLTPDSVAVGWLPHYHDMGLIGQILQPIFAGASLHMTSPSQFLRRPVLWLRLITEHRATHTVGPDFAFALCSRLVTDDQLAELDLSSLKTVITGAEPVRIDTLEAFTARFAPAGFRGEAFVPAFGMAETTLLITAHRDSVPPRAIVVSADALERDEIAPATDGERSAQLVPCGAPGAGMEIAIVDPATATELRDGRIGEIWVRGTSVTQGYWRRPEQTATDFGATLAGVPDEVYLRTGDLGAMIDGELVITGRLKDLIIVRGRNIYPQDLEHSAAELLGTGCLSAAFERPGAAPEVGIVAEVEPSTTPEELDALTRALRARVGEEFTLPALGVALIRKGTLPRTTSGKVQRALTRRLLHEQRLQLVHLDGFEAVRS